MNAQAAVAPTAVSPNDKIKCEIDGAMTHSIQLHIDAKYKGEWTIERYRQEFPEAPLMSPFALDMLAKRRGEKAAPAQQPANAASAPALEAALITGAGGSNYDTGTDHMHTLFEFGDVAAARNASGNPITVRTFGNHGGDHLPYLVPVDREYVFDIDLVKKVLVGLTLNKPILLWGMHGTGKTTVIQQVCARTGRPVMRVQHTINMQESDVLGQWIVRNGQTEFQLGPLPMAMIMGWTYIADEYDFAMPSVTSVYQPVLEGQALVIKDAPPHLRKIIPHEDFRFVATGNTNGCGDETGMYQGTLMQNAANYSRFGVTEEVKYMPVDTETAILRAKAQVPAKPAKQIVDFANKVRDSFRDGKISMTISPRELITAGQLGMAFGGKWLEGMELAFINRLPRIDQKVCRDLGQRIFS